MPTQDPTAALSMDEAREIAGRSCSPQVEHSSPVGRVGLEPELFPIRVDAAGRPSGRVPLEGPAGVLEVVDGLTEENGWLRPRDRSILPPELGLANGGRITFEPGAQVEHSTAVHGTAREALEDLAEVHRRLAGGFAAHDAVLAACGLDLWHDLADVPQQLRSPRYRAMDAYLGRRGSGGRVMMRHSCSLQVNLDTGPPAVARQRWRTANLVSPLVTATFAASPQGESVCGRALAWQDLDPTRTGFPRGILEGSEESLECEWWEAALHADVLLFRLADGDAEPGRAGFTFREWLRHGHPRHGWPTPDDFRYHLTTLFFEVRPRGFLELRAADALPVPWRAALVVLVCGALYDDRARETIHHRLAPLRSRLPELWRLAARRGLGDPELREHAEAVWSVALAGAARLPAEFFRSGDLATAERFLGHFTRRGRCPSDELREALARGPEHALAWAAAT